MFLLALPQFESDVTIQNDSALSIWQRIFVILPWQNRETRLKAWIFFYFYRTALFVSSWRHLFLLPQKDAVQQRELIETWRRYSIFRWMMKYVHRYACGEKWGVNWPWLRVEELLMSPEIKEDSDCFLTVSFHILLIRLCQVNKGKSLGL